MHQKRRTGSFFKWLGLTQEQAGNREPTGKFVVGAGADNHMQLRCCTG
jgi:hypothetical protein